MNSVNTIIIGANLASLTLAHDLVRKGQKVLLLEARDQLSADKRIGLTFIPQREDGFEVLQWLKSLSPAGFSIDERPHQALTFESNEWRDFVGFGDYPSRSVDELAPLYQSTEWWLDPGLDQITRSLMEQLPCDVHLLNEVTGFEVADGQITAVIVNGDKSIVAENYVFAGNVQDAAQLVPRDALKPSHRTRLVKTPTWSALTLHLKHSRPLDASTAMRILPGTGKEFEPVVGRLCGDVSTWLNLIPSEFEEDMEHIGSCIKYVKRVLNRVWPELQETAIEEKILVQPKAYGHLELKLKEPRFPELANLWLLDARLSDQPGRLGGADIARTVSTLFVAEPQNPVLTDSQS